jgi:signal transduction histidine kinase
MKGALSQLRALMDSLTGRVVMILTGGMAAASIASLFVADYVRVRDFERARLEAVVASAADIARRFARDPIHTTELLHKNIIFGVSEAPPTLPEMRPAPQLEPLLIARLGQQSRPTAALMPRAACFPNLDLAIRVAGIDEQTLPECWYVRFHDAGGVERRLSMDIASMKLPRNSTLNPLYPVLIIAASALLAFLVARVATAPLRQLTEAARDFSVTIDPEPIPERGPSEVRAALQTFNVMQHRVREGFRERTQILASIAHDLQTPLTRLRLRLEHVNEEPVRNRLIADLAVMQQLVRDNLDLARSIESREPWSVVDIDSILSSIAEDAAEFGSAVRFTTGCNAQARIKPNALVRCLNNLVDNAVKYAGDAELSCYLEGSEVVINVRDHGPGIPEQVIAEALKPFSRIGAAPYTAASGTGIGLTIARAQAQTFGASLILHNHPDGGLLASVRLKSG